MKKPQTLSLQEQLLKSGLANETKAKQVKAEKRKQTKQQRNNGIEIIDDVKTNVEQLRLQQAERDRELNQLRKQTEEQKALAAQVRQIVETHDMPQDANGIGYQFTDHGKVKTVYVAQKVREALINGRAGIVRLEAEYKIVPLEIAQKIQARHAESLVVLNQEQPESASSDDPYAAYQIPDDLIW
jgi:uncharacterized protein YaiL (DUF2058 family)